MEEKLLVCDRLEQVPVVNEASLQINGVTALKFQGDLAFGNFSCRRVWMKRTFYQRAATMPRKSAEIETVTNERVNQNTRR